MRCRESISASYSKKAAVGGQNMIHSLVAPMPVSGKQQCRGQQSRDRMEGILMINGLSERMKRAPEVPKIVPGTCFSDGSGALSANPCSSPKRPQSSPSCRRTQCGKRRSSRASEHRPTAARINPLLRRNSVVLPHTIARSLVTVRHSSACYVLTCTAAAL